MLMIMVVMVMMVVRMLMRNGMGMFVNFDLIL